MKKTIIPLQRGQQVLINRFNRVGIVLAPIINKSAEIKYRILMSGKHAMSDFEDELINMYYHQNKLEVVEMNENEITIIKL